MGFIIESKDKFIRLTKSSKMSQSLYEKHFKDILESEDCITKYLATIFASYNISKKLYDNEFNKKLQKLCPLYHYEPVNIYNGEDIEMVETNTYYSFSDFYGYLLENEYPAYSLHYILKNYVEEELGIEVNWDIINSPCTKNKFVLKVYDKNGIGLYLRNKDNTNEFEYTQEGYIDAAFKIFLFYNKYI